MLTQQQSKQQQHEVTKQQIVSCSNSWPKKSHQRPAWVIHKRMAKCYTQYKLWNTCLRKLKITCIPCYTPWKWTQPSRIVNGQEKFALKSPLFQHSWILVGTTRVQLRAVESSWERETLSWKPDKRRILTSATLQRTFQTSPLESEFGYQTRELKGQFWTKLAPHGLMLERP